MEKSGGANGGTGSQDISFSNNNFYSGAIIAGAISIAVGAKFSLKLDQKILQFVDLGESAADQRNILESLNYASLSVSPLLFIFQKITIYLFYHLKKRQSGKSIALKAKKFWSKFCPSL